MLFTRRARMARDQVPSYHDPLTALIIDPGDKQSAQDFVDKTLTIRIFDARLGPDIPAFNKGLTVMMDENFDDMLDSLVLHLNLIERPVVYYGSNSCPGAHYALGKSNWQDALSSHKENDATMKVVIDRSNSRKCRRVGPRSSATDNGV